MHIFFEGVINFWNSTVSAISSSCFFFCVTNLGVVLRFDLGRDVLPQKMKWCLYIYQISQKKWPTHISIVLSLGQILTKPTNLLRNFHFCIFVYLFGWKIKKTLRFVLFWHTFWPTFALSTPKGHKWLSGNKITIFPQIISWVLNQQLSIPIWSI